jgi:hypothetical protein
MITLVIFVGLFFLSAILAVVFYMKAEGYRSAGAEVQRQVNDLATRPEIQGLSTVVGAREDLTWLGAMVDYHNRLLLLLLGTPVDSMSAEIKSGMAQTRVKETIQLAQKHVEGEKIDPNTGLIPLAKKLMVVIDTLKTSNESLSRQHGELQTRLDDAVKAGKEMEANLTQQIEDFKQRALAAEKQCEEYKQLVDQTSEERVKTLMEIGRAHV